MTFSQFKDWAFLGLITFLMSILVKSIYDLNQSVRELTENLGEKSGEISMIVSDLKDQSDRIKALETLCGARSFH